MRHSLPIVALLLPLVACVGGGAGSADTIPCAPTEDVVYADLGDGVDYRMEEDCGRWEISGVTVTLEPGVVVQMNDGQDAYVSYDGALNAVGTAELPIVLQGSSESPTWPGLQIDSANQDNVFEHLILAGAGTETMLYQDQPSALVVWGEGYLKASDLHIAHSGGDGLSILSETSGFPGEYGPGLVFEDVAGHPVRLNADHMETLDWGDFESSELGEPTVAAYTSRLEKEAVWSAIALPVRMETDLPVWAGLRVESGVEIQFLAGNSLLVSAAGENPTAEFIGTADAPVVLRGRLEQPGAWGGVLFSSASPANRMEHVRIENGGGVEHTWAGVKANLSLGYGAAILSVRDVEILNSADAGILLDDDLGEVSFTAENLSYSGNAGGDLVDVRED